ncbi:MAG: hypothetical protein ABIZ07_11020 [Dermatophilaceae bacterium]
MSSRTRYADARHLTLWDACALFWVVFWLVVGGWIGYSIWQLTGLTTGVLDSGKAIDTAGRALQDLSKVPVIGDRTGELGNQVVHTAAQITSGSLQAGGSIRALSVLIGTALGFGPMGALLFAYLPWRLGHRAEVRATSRALADPARREAALASLARRALTNLPLEQLLLLTPDPEAELAAGRYEQLAHAEMSRLGLATPNELR